MKHVFFLLPLIYLVGNGYLFWRTWQAMGGLPMWYKILGSLLFWVLVFALFAAIGLCEVPMPDWMLNLMFRIGSGWMVFLLYMVLLLAVFDVARLFLPTMKNPFWYALPLTISLLFYGYINYKNVRVEKLEIKLAKCFGKETMRIVAISDVHLGYGTGHSALKGYVEKINSYNPDIIFISGDLIDNNIKPLLAAPFDKTLSDLRAPMGIYMVPGNHEYICGIDASAEFLKRTPIQLLRDSIVTLPNGIQIVGRDDYSNRHRKSLGELISNTIEAYPIIVLDHQPYQLSETDSLKVDLQLSVHTHRGQVWPLSVLVDNMYEQSHGYRKWSYSHIWVSCGLSLWGPPFRIGTNSDFAVIDLR
jgi:predicted MPP superfamily phosphohydrolase